MDPVFPVKGKWIIAGGRDFSDYDLLVKEAEKLDIDIVVCGMARGADKLGLQYAQEYKIGLKKFPADWNKYGNRAGPIRNAEMGAYADALLAFWDGISTGTANMINYMHKHNKPTIIVSY